MPDAAGHKPYRVNVADVRALAERMKRGAGNAAGDFVFATISDAGAIQHYTVPNGNNAVEGMITLVEAIGAELHQNVYHTMALFKGGTINRNTGRTKENVVLVLGAVCDFDKKNDPATRDRRLPYEPSAEVETSPGHFQSQYWFDHPLGRKEAEPLLSALAETSGADDCKTVEHLWRTPGTWNWPNAKKIAEGRSPEPFQTRWESIALEDTMPTETLRAAIFARDPSAFERVHTQADGAQYFDWKQRKKPGERRELLDDAAIVRALSQKGDRSELAFRLIRRLQRANYSAEEIGSVLLKFANLPVMGHYGEPVDEDRVRDDVRRAFTKRNPAERTLDEMFGNAARSIERAGSKLGVPVRVIQVQGGALVQNVDDAEAALIEQGAPIYQRGELLVRLGEVVIEVRGRRRAKDLLLVPVKRPDLIEHMTAAAHFQRWDARMEEWKLVNCPPQIADAHLARVGRWKLRPLMGIVNAPTLRSDGTLLEQPGYDETTGLIYDPRGIEFPEISAQPSREDALAAVKALEELIGTFPFASREARAVALAAFLTICVRRTLRTAPLFGIDGTGPGTGKGLLADTIAIVGSGRAASPVTAGANEEELEKRVASMLLRGDLAICIDNLNAPLDSAFLCSALTQQTQAVRVLGQSKVVTTPTNSFFMATANGLSFVGDMWRRGLTCLIDPAVERPSERVFDFNPVERAKYDRGRYVAACLTIMRAYQAAGSPAQKGKPMGSFESWCRVVRDALLWLGEVDPVATCVPSADDPERERFAAVILGWQAIIGELPMTLKQAVAVASEAMCEHPPRRELFDAFHAVAAPMVRGSEFKIDVRRLGNWMRNRRRQYIHGLRFMPVGESAGGMRWRLEKAMGKGS